MEFLALLHRIEAHNSSASSGRGYANCLESHGDYLRRITQRPMAALNVQIKESRLIFGTSSMKRKMTGHCGPR